MTVALAPNPFFFWVTPQGQPAVGYQLFTYVAGTSIPQATYIDSTQTTQNTNPIILNSAGYASIWLIVGQSYKFVLQDSAGNPVWSQDQINSIAGFNGSLVPALPNTYNIGSPALTWANGYFGTQVYVAGNPVVSYPQTASELAALIIPVNFEYPPGDIRRYGAVGDGVTNNTAAMASALSQALQPGGTAIKVPIGNYVGQFSFSGTITGVRIYGEDLIGSVLIPTSTTADAIVFNAAASCWGIVIENMTIKAAAGSTAGNGIHLSATMTFAYQFTIRNVNITGFGNSGIYDQLGMFNSILEQVTVNTSTSHAFDLMGGNSLVLKNCYALTVPTGTGKAGFRVHNSSPLLIGCNGVSTGDYWAIFSDNVAEDGQIQSCYPVLDSCNVESFTVAGLRNKQCGITLRNTTVTSHIANNKGMVLTPNTNPGTLDRDNSFINTAGSFANSAAVHVITTSGLPFTVVFSPAQNTQFNYYDEVLATLIPITTLTQQLTASNRYGLSSYDLFLNGIMRYAYSGAQAIAGTTTQAVAFVTTAPFAPTKILMTQSATSTSPPWVTALATTGFTINFTANFTGTVYWQALF